MPKIIINFPHQLLEELVKIWAERFLDITRIYREQTIEGRKLDLLGEKMVSNVDEPQKVFFEIETEVPKSRYINKYLEFCKKQKPFSAYLVAPIRREEYRHWDDERFTFRRTLEIVPIKTVWDYLNLHFYIRFETVKGKITLSLEEK